MINCSHTLVTSLVRNLSSSETLHTSHLFVFFLGWEKQISTLYSSPICIPFMFLFLLKSSILCQVPL